MFENIKKILFKKKYDAENKKIKNKKKKIILSFSAFAVVGAGAGTALPLIMCKNGGSVLLSPSSVMKYMQSILPPKYTVSKNLEADVPVAMDFLNSLPLKYIAYGLCKYYLSD
jgi:hypothetical protein